MDPLDPLTEIINSGQAFSPAIALERIIWLMIGIFFLGAMLSSFTNSIQNQILSSKKSILNFFKSSKNNDEGPPKFSGDDKLN